MIATLATVVDTGDLGQTVVAAFVAGIGVTVVFSLAILGAARFSDANRDGRPVAAMVFGGLALLALLATASIVVTGILLMTAD